MIVIIALVSFYLDGILSMHGNPIFTVISIVLVYPFFKGNDLRYFKFIALIGFLYDVVYFDTIFYNFFIFILLGLVTKKMFYYMSNSFSVNLILSAVVVILYRIVTFISYSIFNDIALDFLFESIVNSIFINLSFSSIAYVIIDILAKKFKIVRK